MQTESLVRTRSGNSMSNYMQIIVGFMEKGIAEEDIKPRENVFTFNAWRALGRTVKKGENGVRVTTYIPVKEVKNLDGTVKRKAGSRP